jgi:hypothetical protein
VSFTGSACRNRGRREPWSESSYRAPLLGWLRRPKPRARGAWLPHVLALAVDDDDGTGAGAGAATTSANLGSNLHVELLRRKRGLLVHSHDRREPWFESSFSSSSLLLLCRCTSRADCRGFWTLTGWGQACYSRGRHGPSFESSYRAPRCCVEIQAAQIAAGFGRLRDGTGDGLAATTAAARADLRLNLHIELLVVCDA